MRSDLYKVETCSSGSYQPWQLTTRGRAALIAETRAPVEKLIKVSQRHSLDNFDARKQDGAREELERESVGGEAVEEVQEVVEEDEGEEQEPKCGGERETTTSSGGESRLSEAVGGQGSHQQHDQEEAPPCRASTWQSLERARPCPCQRRSRSRGCRGGGSFVDDQWS